MANTPIPMQERLEGLERQLEQRTAELLDARKDLENFNYSVSHDLRAPLRHITGYGQIILEDYGKGLDPQCRKYFELIQEDALRMAGMVEDLLRLSHLGKQKLCRQPVALETLVKDVVGDVSRGGGTRQIEWKIGNFPQVHCDAAMVKQVFSHLLGNALKFTRPAAQAVIETGTIYENGSTTFFVRDNGVGFDMKYADKLFTVFQRLHPTQEFEGNGVGLAIAHRIVRLHGGRFWAEASVGHGATFYFTLPEVAGPPRGNSEHVLYVDDEESLVLLARRSLHRLGYQITGYTDPAQALQAFTENPEKFSAVVTDLSMPGMSGVELARQILQIRPEIPIVMTSGYIRPEDEVEAQRLGIRQLLLKPDTIDDLAAALHRVFAGANGNGRNPPID